MHPLTALIPPFDSLLPTKLRPPRLRENRVSRPRLIQQVSDPDAKVVLIVAPAGAGKTTLLTRWALSRDEPVAWLSLGSHDDSLPHFVVYLIASLSSAAPDLAERVRARVLESDEPESHALPVAALNEIARSSGPWSLVLDDFHCITNTDTHAFVSELVEVLPDGCRLVIGSRSEPPLAVARLQVSDDLTLLEFSDLAASSVECTALFHLHGIDLTDDQVSTLIERTGGWLVALHCVARASRMTPIDQVLDSLASFDAQRDLLGEYLLQEVLDRESPELREFLLQISLLDRFTADTCYAVTGRSSTGRLLEQARRGGLFLVGLDESGEWYRLHHLFAEFLSRQLALDADPKTIRSLLAEASRWFEQHNFIEEAISYAIRAEAWELAAPMIATTAIQSLIAHRHEDLLTWMYSFPHEVIVSDPNLSSIAAYALIRQGRVIEAEQFVAAAETRWLADRHDAGLAVVAIARAGAARFREDAAGMIAYGVRGVTLAGGDQPFTPEGILADVMPRPVTFHGTWTEGYPNFISYVYLCIGLVYAGRLVDAETLSQKVQDAISTATIETLATSFIPMTIMLRIAQGRLDAAESIAKHYARPQRDDVPTDRATAMGLLAEVLYERNHLDDARQTILSALRMLQQVGSITSVPALRVQLSQILWASGNAADAQDELGAAVDAASALQNLFRLREAEATWVQLAVREGDLSRARDWVLYRALSHDSDLTSASLNELLVYARVLIASGESEQAVALLDRLRPLLAADGRSHDLIRLLIVLSLAELDLFALDRAVAALAAALAIGEAGGYCRIFLDEGEPMVRLLRVAHRRGVRVGYIRGVLVAAGQAPGEVVRLVHQELAEPITAREIEVLRFIALGLTNKEISEELYLSVATVKRHITNLYGKLGVASRTDAVQLARKLGLLSLDPPPVRQPAQEAQEA